MANPDITHRRLHNQLVTHPTFDNPGDVVRWLGAVQAQDYPGALWAVGLRTRDATEAGIEQAIADRAFVRTWPMRGTLHFVAPEDVRWMLQLLTPRIVAVHARRLLQQHNLDEAALARSKEVLVGALQGGKQLSRPAIYRVLEAAGISATGQRGLQILWRLAQEGLICFAARQGKQPTFALLDEWVPISLSKTPARDEALADLALLYFTGHGPATVQDFAWWSGLPAADARAALEMAKPQLTQEVIGGHTFWLSSANLPTRDASPNASPTAHLLPAYDEYTVGYTNRTPILDRAHAPQANSEILNPSIALDGQIVGTWKRMLNKDSVTITPQLFTTLSDAENHALAAAASRYGKFLNLPVVL